MSEIKHSFCWPTGAEIGMADINGHRTLWLTGRAGRNVAPLKLNCSCMYVAFCTFSMFHGGKVDGREPIVLFYLRERHDR